MAGPFAPRRTNTICAIVAATAMISVSAFAQSPDLRNIEQDLERSRADSEDLARKSEEVRLELRLLKGRMINVARKTLDLESELSAIEETIVSLEEEEREKSAALKRQRRQLGQTLGALQRIALLPPEALVAAPGSPLDAVRSATLLKVAVPALERKADLLKQDLYELDQLRVRIEREKNGVVKDLGAGILLCDLASGQPLTLAVGAEVLSTSAVTAIRELGTTEVEVRTGRSTYALRLEASEAPDE